MASNDLHGSCADSSRVALLIIDMINELDFPEAEQLRPQAEADTTSSGQLELQRDLDPKRGSPREQGER